MHRFIRSERLLGSQALEILKKSHVVIVGLGAVGGYALEGLTRCGIGKLRLVDFDVVNLSNLNRQVLALESTRGMKKTDVAKARVVDINPDCEVEILPVFAHTDTMSEILSGHPDLIVDAIDSMAPKAELLAAAFHRKLTCVSSMGAALRRDPSYIKTGDVMETHGCTMARHVRKYLRKRGVGHGITCVYSNEPVNFQYRDASEEEPESPGEAFQQGRPRKVLGSLPTVTGIFGLTLAQLGIDKLLKDNGLQQTL